MPESPLLEALARFQAQLTARDNAAMERLIRNYLSSWQRLETLLDRLLLQIGDDVPTKGQLYRMGRYRSLMNQVEAELSGLQTLTGNEIRDAANIGINLGKSNMEDLLSISITGGAELSTMFDVLPKSAIETVLGFLDPESPLYARLQMLAPTAADAVASAIVENITIGKNPRFTARQVQNAFGRGLHDAMRFVRTVQNWAYREANRAVMASHENILEGWIWVAAIGDPRTCMSCIAMHGTFHPVYEPLNDHHNGRCRPAPKVIGYENPVEEVGTEWFEKQSESVQRQYLGRGKYNAWKDGKFDLSDIVGEYQDDVYGAMRVEKTLQELISSDVYEYYRYPNRFR